MKREKIKVTHEVYKDQFKHQCYSLVRYFIYPNSKVIVCKLEPYIQEISDDKLTSSAIFDRDFFGYCSNNAVSFVGKAICMEEDTFNIALGKKIAYDKAMLKLLQKKKSMFLDSANTYEQIKVSLEAEANKIDIACEKVTERLNKKIEEMNK